MSAAPALQSLAALGTLACPGCGRRLRADADALRDDAGHAFDLARQGYAALLTGSHPGGADTAEMVAARDRLLGSGLYRPIAESVVDAVPADARGLAVDAGGGTGWYLASLLDGRPALSGLVLDASTYAVRRAARAHPRAAAATTDLRGRWPLGDATATVVLDVFSPRNGAECARVLEPDGRLIVVTPLPGHLAELRPLLGTIGIDAEKQQRLRASLPEFVERACATVEYTVDCVPETVRDLALMGPSAHHLDRDALGRIPGPLAVTIAVEIRTFAVGSLRA